MKKFETVEECFAFLKLPVPTESSFPADDVKDSMSNYLLKRVIKAHIEANQPGWVADASDDDQEKYYNYFWTVEDSDNSSGFGFSLSYTYYVFTFTFVGARFCMPSREMCKAIVDNPNFKQLYLDTLTIPIVR